MPSVFAVTRNYVEGDELVSLHASERGARLAVYLEVNHWEGRVLWWPAGVDHWVVQLLLRDVLRPGKVRLLHSRWTIKRMEVLP